MAVRRIALILVLFAAHARAGEQNDPPLIFRTEVQPIFERRCQPCHFPGGVMHAKLPFDRGQTIVLLGEKVFTRIKKDDERAVIRRFLAEQKQ